MVRYLEAIQSELTPDIIDHLNRPGINIWRGPGRAGKSCAMHWAVETIHKGRNVKFYGVPETLKEHLPDYFEPIDTILFVEEGDVLLIDDSAIQSLYSRDASTKANKQWSKAMTIISHWNVTINLTIQSLTALDVASLCMQRFTIIQKEGRAATLSNEREDYKSAMLFGRMAITAIANKKYQKEKEFAKDQTMPEWEYFKHFVYIHTPYNVVIPTGIASYWNDNLSRPYKDYRFEKEKELVI